MLWKIPELFLNQNPLEYRKPKRPDTRRYGGGGTSVKTFDPFKKTAIPKLYRQLGTQISEQIGQGVPTYQGQTVAGLSPLQSQGYGLASGIPSMVQGSQNYYQDVMDYAQPEQASQFMNMAQQNLASATQPMDYEAATDYWNKAFVDPSIQTWQNKVAPGIMERYGTDGMGGALGQQLSRSGQEMMTGLSGQLADIQYQGQQAGLNRQLQGAGVAGNLAMQPGNIISQAGQIGGQGTDQLSQLLNIGGQQRGIEQEGLTAAQNQWAQAQPYNNPYLLNWLQTALQQSGSQPIVQQGSAGLGTSLLSGMMPALGTGLGNYVAGGGLNNLGTGAMAALGSGASLFSSLFGGGAAAGGVMGEGAGGGAIMAMA